MDEPSIRIEIGRRGLRGLRAEERILTASSGTGARSSTGRRHPSAGRVCPRLVRC